MYSALIFIIPFIFTRATEQIFEFNKFIFLLIFSAFITALFALYLIKKNKVQIPTLSKLQKVSMALFAIFFSFLVISTIFSVSPLESFYGSYFRNQGLILFLNVFLLSAIAVFLQITKQEFVYFFAIPLIIAGVLESAIAIIQDIFPNKFFTDLKLEGYHNREIGTFGQPNLLGRFLIFPFFICFYFLFDNFKKQNLKIKILLIFFLLIILIGLFTTSSRGTYVGILCGFIFLLTHHFVNAKKIKLLIISFIVLMILSSTFFLINKNEFSKRNDATFMRIITWQQTPKAIIEKPIFGWGIEQQENAYAKIADEKLVKSSAGGVLDRAHNEILDFLIQIGIFGTLSYLTFLFFAFYLGIKTLKTNPYYLGILTAIFASFCARQFDFFSIAENLYFFLFLGIIAFQANNQHIKVPIKVWHYLASFIYISFSIFTIYSAQNIWQADKLYFEKQTKKAYEKTPWNKIYTKRQIQELLYTNNFEKAEIIIKNLQKKHPTWHETYYLWLQFYAFQDNQKGAFESINKAIELFPNNPNYQEIREKLNFTIK